MYTAENLIAMFRRNSWNDITLTMENGDVLSLSLCSGLDRITSAEDVEFILICGGKLPYISDDTFERVAESLNNYTDLCDKSFDEKEELRKFRINHIDGHSKEELRLGNDCAITAWHESIETKVGSEVICNSDEFVKRMAERFCKTPAEIKSAIDLSEAWSSYSDRYKDLYGYRPR